MQNMKRSGNSCEAAKPKERHIVSWSQEEDDILREQIRIHGTDNWTIIASKFKDKTTRQCRRRWFTYLNSDFKKGGWSPEEDMLLCEAQKIFGNRWTEIAKVVSGRTDNAVKNRFTTLCKKRAKHEALAKENSNSYINLNNKRVIFPDGLDIDNITEGAAIKKLRTSNISDVLQNGKSREKSVGDMAHPVLRHPFAVLAQNLHNAGTTENASDNKTQGTFLKKDDPKIHALMEQAELLSSLAMKVNTENTDQSLESAWKILQDFLQQTKDGDTLKFQLPEMNFEPDDYKNLIADSRSSNEGSRPSWRQPALSEDSAGSSEYSTGSTLLSHALADKTDESQTEVCAHHQDIESELRTSQMSDQAGLHELENGTSCRVSTTRDTLPVCDEEKVNNGPATAECDFLNTDYSSPLQVTPFFRSLAAEIPTPKFSESLPTVARAIYDARTLQKCRRLRVRSSKSSSFWRFQHGCGNSFGESEQHRKQSKINGEAVPIENTRRGVHKSFTTSFVQKSPPPQSITNFTDQTLYRFCRKHLYDLSFFQEALEDLVYNLECNEGILAFLWRSDR